MTAFAPAIAKLDPLAVTLEGLTFRYGATRVLTAVDLSFRPGTVTALLGPNGAGKSTLLRLAAGLLEPATGAVRLGDALVHSMTRAAVAKTLAFSGAEPAPAFAWTALEVVLMGRAPWLGRRQLESPEDIASAEGALALLGAAHLSPRAVTELSAGERQRVWLARALAQDTPVLLLDEPTSHQDPAHALEIGRVLRDLAWRGRTVVAALHDLNLAARVADRLVFLKAGKVAAEGPPAETLTPAVVGEVFAVPSRLVPGSPPAIVLGGAEPPPSPDAAKAPPPSEGPPPTSDP